MNRQNTKRIPKYIGLGLLLAVFIGGLSLPVTVNARQIEDPEIKKGQMAAEACKKESKKADKNGDSKYASCITGFKAGINGEKKNKACDKDPYPAVCKAGFDKGKAEASSGGGGTNNPTPIKSDPNDFDPDLSSLPDASTGKDKINTIVSIAFGIAGALALLFIVIGGLRYILSSGNPETSAQAKNTIVYALVGLVITIAAYGIVVFVINNV